MVRGLLLCFSLVFVASAQNAQSNTGTIGNQGQQVGGFNLPGFGQSGISRPGFSRTGLGQPGFVQSGLNQPGFGQSSFGQPGLNQPSFRQPGFGQSGISRPSFRQPDFGQSSFVQPIFDQVDFFQPSFDQVDFVQPSFDQVDFVQPSFDQVDFVQPGLNQPSFSQPDFGQSGFGQLGVDRDGDKIPDESDICPDDAMIHTSDFTDFRNESLDKITTGQKQAVFYVNKQGTGVTQSVNSKPGLMYGPHNMTGLDFDGTFIINHASDDDYVGFIFGYNSPQSFYVVMWKKNDQRAFECGDSSEAERGLQLKRVHSITGPSCELQDALWSNKSTTDQVELLWHDPNRVGWNHSTTYDWELIHRPNIGLIRFKFSKGNVVIADSGNIYDNEIKGGHIGLYCHSQEGIVWSKLRYSCDDDTVPTEIFNDLPKGKQDKIREKLRGW